MEILFGIFFLALGLIVGSFLNVVILRWDTRKSFVSGRSVCAHTGQPLPWYDLVPVVSYVVLRGRSRFSGKALSIQYPLVELITGVLFVGLWWQFFVQISTELTVVYIVQFALMLVVAGVLVVITFYDLRTKIIPNQLVYSFITLSFLIFLLEASPTFFSDSENIWRLLAAPILWFPFAALWFVSRGAWMGYGDAKLAWGIGWFLGLVSGASAIVLAFWIGAVVGVLLVGLKKFSQKYSRFLPDNLSVKSEIPFAPFIILSVFLVFFFGWNVFLLF